MRRNLYCPKCFSAVDTEQSFGGICVCKCGQVVNLDHAKKPQKRRAQASNLGIYMIGLLLMLATLQVANWDTYSLEIIPLKAKQWTEQASVDDLKRITKICKFRKKLGCQEDALLALNAIEPNPNVLIEAGNLQLQQEDYENAVSSLAKALKQKPRNEQLRYNYAMALMGAGDNLNASKQLHYLVFKDRRRTNAKAALDYVDLLILSNDYALAKQVISYTRKKNKLANMFAQKQLKLINKKIAASKVASGH